MHSSQIYSKINENYNQINADRCQTKKINFLLNFWHYFYMSRPKFYVLRNLSALLLIPPRGAGGSGIPFRPMTNTLKINFKLS